MNLITRKLWHLVQIAINLPQSVSRSGGLLKAVCKTFVVLKREGFKGIAARLGNPIDNNNYQKWILLYDTISDKTRASMRQKVEHMAHKPLISVVMPTYNPKPEWVIEAIESVRKQIYPHWELCIADDASTDKSIRPILERYAKVDSRIKVVFREQNGHISAASNSALEIAEGEWVALLDHDDILSEKALLLVAETTNQHPDAKLIYSDEDKIDEKGNRSMPFFKPDWSPHLMLSQAYLGHLVCYKKTLIDAVGKFDTELNGAQDYGLALSCIAHIEASQVKHIPSILYHWRIHSESTAQHGLAKPYAHTAGRKAVEMYIKNKYSEFGMLTTDGEYLFTYSAKFEHPTNPLVSIIIPTRDGLTYLKPCIDSIFERSSWKNLEVLIIDNGSEKTETLEYLKEIVLKETRIRVINVPIPFNWSKLNNIGVQHALGSMFIFLNNDTQVITPSWIELMIGYAGLPDVGTVGALLFFEDGSIQHSGVVVGMGGWADHVFRTMTPKHTGVGPFLSPVITRNVLAVTGACVAISRERFDYLGGFDESFLICGSDVELSLRAHKLGFFNVMCAEAKLFHYESKTRTPDVPSEDFKQSAEKYAPYREDQVDPYYNPNLSLSATTPSIKGSHYDA